MRNGFSATSVGQMGYVIAHEVAAACLAVGTPVIVDAVNPVHEAREGWLRLAELAAVPVRVIEVQLDDVSEHRRRVEQRRSDLDGQKVPTWDQVITAEYQPWDEERDGPRLIVNGSSPDSAVEAILGYVGLP
jgi:predicted kinase